MKRGRGARRSPAAGVLSRGFPPIVGEKPRTLVLGSLPGQKSLEMGQYYAQPHNTFWKIMGELFGAGPALPYEARLERLTARRIAVWDVLAAGERPGSLDSAIVAETIVVNDFAAFFDRHEGIELICFNGAKAASLYRRHVQHALPERFARIEALQLPSTSPAHAALRLADKLLLWSAALGVRATEWTHGRAPCDG